METNDSPALPPDQASPGSVPRRGAANPIEATIRSLRIALVLLGTGLLVCSVCLNLFVYKQNRLLIQQIDGQTRMLNQHEPIFANNQQRLGLLLQELRGYAQTHPDILPMLAKYGIVRVQPNYGPAATASTPPPAR